MDSILIERNGNRYKLHIPNKDNNGLYYTFIPKPLDKVGILISNEIYDLLINAYRWINMLESISIYAPHIDIIQNYLMRKEFVHSFNVDSHCVSLSDTFAGCSESGEYAVMFDSYFKTVEFICNTKVNIGNICKAHKLLMDGYDNAPGQLRKNQTFLSDAIFDPLIEVYNPTAPSDIAETLNILEKYIFDNSSHINLLIKIALVHYQFEVIHPFETGNGKIGRLIIYWLLNQNTMLSRPLLCISEQLLLNRELYFEDIKRVERYGKYIEWVKFVLEKVALAAEKNVQIIKLAEKTIAADLQKVKTFSASIRSIESVYRYLLENPISSVNEIADGLGISFNTASKAVNELINIEIVTQFNKKIRYRKFIYSKLLKLFV